MGTNQSRYTAEFNAEAVNQVVERGYPVREVAQRLGISAWSLYQWLRAHREADSPAAVAAQDAAIEIRRLRSELRRVTEERDILRMATAYFAKQSTCGTPSSASSRCSTRCARYAAYCVCTRAGTTPGWRARRAGAEGKTKCCSDTSSMPGSRAAASTGTARIHTGLRELDAGCGKQRVHRLMRAEGLRSQSGYRRRPAPRGSRPSVLTPNRLQQQFSAAEPNRARVTGITHVRTHQGWLYLAVVIDLYSRHVIG